MNATTKRLTLAAVRAELRTIGMTIRHRDGEYRINFKDGKEESAGYQYDLEDALGTARDMAVRAAAVRARAGELMMSLPSDTAYAIVRRIITEYRLTTEDVLNAAIRTALRNEVQRRVEAQS